MRGGLAVNQTTTRPTDDEDLSPVEIFATAESASKMLPSGACTMCRRFIGAASTCPYCGSTGQSRISLRLCRRVAVVAAVAGLIAIWWAARSHTPPEISIAAIKPTMHRAIVALRGQVVRQPRVHHTSGRPDYVSFPIADDSNVIYACAYSPLAGQLVNEGLLPKQGDRIVVTGTLTLSDAGVMRLRLDSAEAIVIGAAPNDQLKP